MIPSLKVLAMSSLRTQQRKRARLIQERLREVEALARVEASQPANVTNSIRVSAVSYDNIVNDSNCNDKQESVQGSDECSSESESEYLTESDDSYTSDTEGLKTELVTWYASNSITQL